MEAAVADESGARCVVCLTKYSHCEDYDEEAYEQPHISSISDSTTAFDIQEDETLTSKNKRKHQKDKWTWIKQLKPTEILSSAKTIAVKAQIMNWISENANVKVIVFTQWIGMVHIISKVCQAEAWKALPFYGGMSLEERQSSIERFREYNNGPCILISSLKCGGVGLNLTMASKVSISEVLHRMACLT